ncbi:MAG: phosphoribosylanthranilate isomerase [Burkholderiales bacterium]|nr:phosphoribosylanthranilate isomerase [Opitutaceae bacterium]
MIAGVTVKVCGLRRAEDAALAAELGADFLGFILYPKSPRYLAPEDYTALAAMLPQGPRRVAVMVEPTPAELMAAREAGFDRFQIHARQDLPVGRVREWADLVGAGALWLAPKLPPGSAFPVDWLAHAEAFLVDTYHAAGFGGSGQTGDWSGFAGLAAAHPDKTWILAGGLGPENIADALARSGTRFVDVNSGVEAGPGVKSAEKLRAFVAALADAAARR